MTLYGLGFPVLRLSTSDLWYLQMYHVLCFPQTHIIGKMILHYSGHLVFFI